MPCFPKTKTRERCYRKGIFSVNAAKPPRSPITDTRNPERNTIRHNPRIPHPSFPGMPHPSFPGIPHPSFPWDFPTRHSPRIPPPSFPGIPPLSFPPVVSGNPEKRAMNPIDLAPRLTYAVMAPSCDDAADTRHFVLVPGMPHPSFPGIPPLSFPPVVSGNPERRAMTPIDLAPRIPVAVMAPSCDDAADTRRFVLVPGISPPVIPVAFPTRHSRRLLAGIQKKEP